MYLLKITIALGVAIFLVLPSGAQYRPKMTVDAWQLPASGKTDTAPKWVNEEIASGRLFAFKNASEGLMIRAAKGQPPQQVKPTDWIVRATSGVMIARDDATFREQMERAR